jgi:hypothetical protein
MFNREVITVQLGDREIQITVDSFPYIVSGNVAGRSSFIKDCFNFYGGGKVGPFERVKDWHPWQSVPSYIESFVVHFQDKTLKDLCLTFYKWELEFDTLNKEWFDALARFLGLPERPNPESYRSIIRKRKRVKETDIQRWAKRE